jgi:hypothetical protein
MKSVKRIFFCGKCLYQYTVKEERHYEGCPSFLDIMSPQGQMSQMWSPEHAVKEHSSYNDLAI